MKRGKVVGVDEVCVSIHGDICSRCNDVDGV